MPRKRSKQLAAATTGDFLRFLRVVPNAKTLTSTLQAAPDPVIKVISNAALNALRGPVRLSPSQRKIFARHRPIFNRLASPRVSVAAKRKYLVRQRGGAFPLIPLIIGLAAGALTSTFVRNVAAGRAKEAAA